MRRRSQKWTTDTSNKNLSSRMSTMRTLDMLGPGNLLTVNTTNPPAPDPAAAGAGGIIAGLTVIDGREGV